MAIAMRQSVEDLIFSFPADDSTPSTFVSIEEMYQQYFLFRILSIQSKKEYFILLSNVVENEVRSYGLLILRGLNDRFFKG